MNNIESLNHLLVEDNTVAVKVLLNNACDNHNSIVALMRDCTTLSRNAQAKLAAIIVADANLCQRFFSAVFGDECAAQLAELDFTAKILLTGSFSGCFAQAALGNNR